VTSKRHVTGFRDHRQRFEQTALELDGSVQIDRSIRPRLPVLQSI